ncbi:hypothetical protein APR41_10035 [Salegentibacter salinarum]|uniref:DUF4258 domain-containing protein n=1 Tax=Salegentibacter salinarum TaxID=447422 RepID=A0A2N0TN26_9FLAO|nr:DUF4258 domain-containing protein [Salegentibacter salinarum]PKD16124.1 hypothetical protein APR41_10035 [Salegentibacter salinarum]SKB69089.1 hypothetical protein SAMN05660903_02099 [Salegentibacter salinarum]
MKLIHRIGYFSVGLFFGIMILLFFLSGKKTSCDYSPDARVLKNIRIKERVFTEEAFSYFENNKLDTALVSLSLEDGDVDFSRSNTETGPCNIYLITNEVDSAILELQIENCDSTATIQKAVLKD